MALLLTIAQRPPPLEWAQLRRLECVTLCLPLAVCRKKAVSMNQPMALCSQTQAIYANKIFEGNSPQESLTLRSGLITPHWYLFPVSGALSLQLCYRS